MQYLIIFLKLFSLLIISFIRKFLYEIIFMGSFIVYIFGASLQIWRGPYDIFYWWTAEITELVLIILVFGLIVWFITKEPGQSRTVEERVDGVTKMLGKFFGKE